MRLTAGFLSVGLLGAMAAVAQEGSSSKLHELDDREKKVVTKAFFEALKDPDSAKIRWMPFNGNKYYCGQVNATNSYGGYTGYKYFNIDVDVDTGGRITATKGQMRIVDADKMPAAAQEIVKKMITDECRKSSE